MLTALLIATVMLSQAQAGAPEPLLARFLGEWHGEGTVMNLPSKITMTWEPALGRKFTRLSFRNEMSAPDGKRVVFEGHAYYKARPDGTYEARWFDSNGASHPVAGAVKGNSLVAEWGTPETEQGRTTYELLPDGRASVRDEVRSKKTGEWRVFGESVFRRTTR